MTEQRELAADLAEFRRLNDKLGPEREKAITACLMVLDAKRKERADHVPL